MGRKINMEKIDDITRCQVTFSKRRTSLMKKANEIAICCDVDVAFVAFSPSGRVSRFCNHRRIEDVLHRYVSLPAEMRLNHISNVQNKMMKLRHLDYVKGETSKLQYLDKQIENLELQIKKRGLEMQILETDLRDYELDPDQEPSLHQLSWCERNINHSLERVVAKKNALVGNMSTTCTPQSFQVDQAELENQDDVPFSSNFKDNESTLTTQNHATGQILMHLDPWISPYSARVRESIFQDLLDQTKCSPNTNPRISNTSNLPVSSTVSNFQTSHSPIILESGNMATLDAQIPPSETPQQQPLRVDQTLLTFLPQNKVNDWNYFPSVTSSNIIHNSNQNLCTAQSPRFRSTTVVTANTNSVSIPQYDKKATSLQYATLNLSQFANTEARDVSQININYEKNSRDGNVDEENSFRAHCNKIHAINQSMDPRQTHAQKEVSSNAFFNNMQQEDTFGDNASCTLKIQKSNLWEWEDLFLDENFNVADYSK